MNACSMYIQYKLNVLSGYIERCYSTQERRNSLSSKRCYVLLPTPAQIKRLDKAQVEGRRAQIRLSARQVAKNVSYTGAVLAVLASLAARAIPLDAHVLPTILSGLATGLLSGGINKAISGSAVEDGLYLHKRDKCYRVQKCKGNGL